MIKRLLTISLALILVLISIAPVYGDSINGNNQGKSDILNKLNQQSNGHLVFYENEERFFLSGVLSEKRQANKEDAINYLEANKGLFELQSVIGNFDVAKVTEDELGGTFVVLNQKVNGLTLKDKQVIIHYAEDGTIVSLNGDLQKKQEITKLGKGNISENEAIEVAKAQVTFNVLKQEPVVERLILINEGHLYEVYKVQIYYNDPEIGNWEIFVEMHSGQVLTINDLIRYDGTVTGSGIDVSGVEKPLNLYLSGTTYTMKDMTKLLPTSIYTYTMNGGKTTGYLVSNISSYFESEAFKASVSAHYNAGIVYDFYKNIFSRNSLDNSGMALKSFVHYGRNYNNAFWDGYEMIYGDGDGTLFTYLSGDLDVVGHEMTHGVISKTANLTYANQSGALNESMADVFGVLIETYDKYKVATQGRENWKYDPSDWVVGDDIYTPNISGDALRSLVNPKLYGQPDHMSAYYVTTADNGGVHTNSGIPNKAAALIASTIGLEKTASIYYSALTTNMTTTTDFVQAYNALYQAANYLYPSDTSIAKAVKDAFVTVGIITTELVNVPVSGVSLKESTVKVFLNKSVQLTPIITPLEATNKSVSWKSSNTKVATVDANGKVTGKGIGTAVITVTTVDGGFNATCSAIVTRK